MSDTAQTPLAAARRIVVKVGSSLICDPVSGDVSTRLFTDIATDVAAWLGDGRQVAIVSSGAVALGRGPLGFADRPKRLDDKQACAAAGQAVLMGAWQNAFASHGVTIAQALLTLDDTERRRRWLNARATLDRLFARGAVPVVNENDTVATDELRYGDNDRLAARVAQMIGADVLVLLSDVDGLYTADPRRDPGARRLDRVAAITDEVQGYAGDVGSDVGSGGMRSKIEAAVIACGAGCATVIAPGSIGEGKRPLDALAHGGPATWFDVATTPAAARKQWIAGTLKPAGVAVVDAGAEAALHAGKSLLPAGVTKVEGAFEKGDAIRVVSASGVEIARGLAAYGAVDARVIVGAKRGEAALRLGYNGPDELIHRNDLVIAATAKATS